jgi:hypothetical protein
MANYKDNASTKGQPTIYKHNTRRSKRMTNLVEYQVKKAETSIIHNYIQYI